MMTIVNRSAYRFMRLEDSNLPALQSKLNKIAQSLALKGTILLSPEGINLALAGTMKNMTQFKIKLETTLPELSNLDYRETYSDTQPFQKLLVKVKKQIIPFPDRAMPLAKETAPYITPATLLAWLKEKRDVIILDTRNHYEVEVGSFQNKIAMALRHFRDFPQAAHQLPLTFKRKPVITFCTGGIRCEKASGTLLNQGFQEVYQLKGGILNYFNHCGDQYYQGGCFVFDERRVVYPNQKNLF